MYICTSLSIHVYDTTVGYIVCVHIYSIYIYAYTVITHVLVYIYIYMCIHMCIYIIDLSTHLTIYLSTSLSLSMDLSICFLSIYLSLSMSTYLPIYLPLCLSIHRMNQGRTKSGRRFEYIYIVLTYIHTCI